MFGHWGVGTFLGVLRLGLSWGSGLGHDQRISRPY